MDIGEVTSIGLDADQRLDVAVQLVEAFWGEQASETAVEELSAVERRLDVSLPHALREGHRRLLTTPAINSQDRFVRACELALGDGVLRIRVENQGCAEWGVRLDDYEGDPQVWIKVGDGRWRRDEGTLSSFLIVSVLNEASTASRYCGDAHLDAGGIHEIRSQFRQLDIEPFVFWADPAAGCAFYGGDDVLVAVHGETWAWVAARSDEKLVQVLDSITPGPPA